VGGGQDLRYALPNREPLAARNGLDHLRMLVFALAPVEEVTVAVDGVVVAHAAPSPANRVLWTAPYVDGRCYQRILSPCC